MAAVDTGTQGVGLVVKSNADIEREDAERERTVAEQQNKPVILGLANYVRKCFSAAKSAKATIENEMQMCLRMRRGEYEPDKLKAIQDAGGSAIYMRLTEEKCVAAESWLIDIIINQQDKPWGIKPTPVPDINPNIKLRIEQELADRLRTDLASGAITPDMFNDAVKEAEDMLGSFIRTAVREASVKLEKEIDDILIEGGFYNVLKGLIYDITTFHNGFIKSPVIRFKTKLRWENDRLVPKNVLCIEFDRPSPLDMYPSPASTELGDGYIIEHHRMFRSELQSLIGVQGYNKDAIKRVMKSSAMGSIGSWLIEDNSANIENEKIDTEEDYSPESKIDALQFWGNISGRQLIEFGLDNNEIHDPDIDYPCEVWLIGNDVIRASINPDKLGRPPYSMASFRNRPGSFWGESLAWILKDTQDLCNSSARNLVNNMAISSGPQVGVDVSAIPSGEDVTKMYPWKIWQFSKPQGNPLWFFQPTSLTAELLKIYEFFSSEADSKSGIPKYSYGTGTTSGALSTATGYTMMLNNATRGIKAVVLNIDDVVEDVVTRLFQWKMIYAPFSYKGDAQIVAKGSSSLIAKEQMQIRKQELLNIISGNPVFVQALPIENILELLRGVVEGADLDVDNIVPSKEEYKRIAMENQRKQQAAIEAQQQQQYQPAQVNGAGQLVSGQEHGIYGGTRG